MSSDRELARLIDRLTWAEQAAARARDEFLSLRNAVNAAGELALWERLDSAERALRDAIRELDELIYPAGHAAPGG